MSNCLADIYNYGNTIITFRMVQSGNWFLAFRDVGSVLIVNILNQGNNVIYTQNGSTLTAPLFSDSAPVITLTPLNQNPINLNYINKIRGDITGQGIPSSYCDSGAQLGSPSSSFGAVISSSNSKTWLWIGLGILLLVIFLAVIFAMMPKGYRRRR